MSDRRISERWRAAWRRTSDPAKTAFLAIALIGSGACLGYDVGIEVAIELRVAPPTLRVPMGEGFATLREASLRMASVELVSCDAIELATRRDLWLSRVHAHELDASGPARWVDARHTSGSFTGWVLRPAPGRYCALRVHLEPSDDVPSFALVGEADAPFATMFATIADGPLDVDLPLALTLRAPEDGRTIVLDVDPACWLAGGAPSEDELVGRLSRCL